MRKQKIYLETTMFNYYFELERDAYKDTLKLFNEIDTGRYEAFTSVYVTDEILKADEPKRSEMLKLINKYKIIVLPASSEVENLTDIYINSSMIPVKYRKYKY